MAAPAINSPESEAFEFLNFISEDPLFAPPYGAPDDEALATSVNIAILPDD